VYITGDRTRSAGPRSSIEDSFPVAAGRYRAADLVDGVSDGEQFGAGASSLSLQQSDNQRPGVVVVALVGVDHRHAELRIRPERAYTTHRVKYSI